MKSKSRVRQHVQFKPRRRPLPVDASVASKELTRILDKHGELRPIHVVEESKPKSAPLHACFEWDDGVAAQEYRLYQARNIINIIEVVYESDTGRKSTVQKFVNVRRIDDDGERDQSYRPIEVVMKDPTMSAQLVRECLNDLLTVRDKYRNLNEFQLVWSAIDNLDRSFSRV